MHLVYPQIFLYNHRFQFLLGLQSSQEKSKTMVLKHLVGGGGGGVGVGKVHYGLGENSE